jgi:hypothetical protein
MRRDAWFCPNGTNVYRRHSLAGPAARALELPGSVIYVETTFDGLAAVAIVNLGHHGIVTAHPAQA